VLADARPAAAEPDRMETKTMTAMTTMMNRKTLSSFWMTESRSLRDAAMAFFSR